MAALAKARQPIGLSPGLSAVFCLMTSEHSRLTLSYWTNGRFGSRKSSGNRMIRKTSPLKRTRPA